MVNDNETNFDYECWFLSLAELLTLLGREDLLQDMRQLDVEAAFSRLAELQNEFQRVFVSRQQHKGIESNETIKGITAAIGRLEGMRDELKEMRQRAFIDGPKELYSSGETGK